MDRITVRLGILILLITPLFPVGSAHAGTAYPGSDTGISPMNKSIPLTNKNTDAGSRNDGDARNKAKSSDTVLYENYQRCYAVLISDTIGKSQEEMENRKTVLKKYCRAITQAKDQKKFAVCYDDAVKGRSVTEKTIDTAIDGCLVNNSN